MKLTLTYDDVSVAASALQLKAREAQIAHRRRILARKSRDLWKDL